MTQARRVYLAGLTFAQDVQCQAEWLVLWQRVAGGLTPGQQREIFQRHATSLGLSGGKAPKRVPPQVEREGLRLLASLEHLPAAQRTALGAELLARLRRDRRNTTLLWAVGRAGARVPAHGPLNTVVAPAIAGQWAAGLLDLVPVSDDLAATVVQLTARTGDAARDVDEDTRRALYDRLVDGAHLVRLLEILPATDAETARAFGERLPEGLRLVDGRGTAVVD
jgi:hypothetical protein